MHNTSHFPFVHISKRIHSARIFDISPDMMYGEQSKRPLTKDVTKESYHIVQSVHSLTWPDVQ